MNQYYGCQVSILQKKNSAFPPNKYMYFVNLSSKVSSELLLIKLVNRLNMNGIKGSSQVGNCTLHVLQTHGHFIYLDRIWLGNKFGINIFI